MKNNLKKKAKAANLMANGLNAIIHWQPFNIGPMRALYRWAHKVRATDPAWTEFLQQQLEEKSPENEDHVPDDNSGDESGPVLSPA